MSRAPSHGCHVGHDEGYGVTNHKPKLPRGTIMLLRIKQNHRSATKGNNAFNGSITPEVLLMEAITPEVLFMKAINPEVPHQLPNSNSISEHKSQKQIMYHTDNNIK